MQSDSDLVRLFQTGDRGAFEELVNRYYQRIYRLAYASLKSGDDAADVTQEVFQRAYTGLHRFRFKAEPFSWLFRTMSNVCREYNRKRRLDLDIVEVEPSNDSFENALLARWELEHLRRCVLGLPRRQRDVFLLRVFEDRSVEQTAQILGCRKGTVKSLLHSALNTIHDIAERDLPRKPDNG